MKRRLTHREVYDQAAVIAGYVNGRSWPHPLPRCYPIPRGGVPVVYILKSIVPIAIVDNPDLADFFVDDIIDSGATRERYKRYGRPFFALVDKTRQSSLEGVWIEFPWEGELTSDMETTVLRLLQQIGEDTTRGGLIETPARVARAWGEWTAGYHQDPSEVLKVFEDGGEHYDEMILVKDIPFYSHCEHHMAPFFGTAHIAYIPDGKIIGLSKMPRLLNIFARRLQVQERLTAQVADALMDHLHPRGVAVSLSARHLCMESRGIQKQGSETVTTVVRGVFKEDEAARNEFLSNINR